VIYITVTKIATFLTQYSTHPLEITLEKKARALSSLEITLEKK
jgi:hypothetical protein